MDFGRSQSTTKDTPPTTNSKTNNPLAEIDRSLRQKLKMTDNIELIEKKVKEEALKARLEQER
jgi:hypothetical protein